MNGPESKYQMNQADVCRLIVGTGRDLCLLFVLDLVYSNEASVSVLNVHPLTSIKYTSDILPT